MIKAVLIDIDNTLLDFNKSAEESMRISCVKNNLPFDKNFFITFKRINDGLWLKIEKGDMSRQDLHKVRWNIIFNELGINFDGVAFEKDFLDNLYNCAVKVDYALETVEYLSSKYILCSASNAFYNQQINRLKISGLLPYFNYNFVSEKLGAQKPKKEFFDKCFSYLNGINKEEVIIIGDSVSADIIGGKEYGLKTLWFNRDNESKEENVADYSVDKLEKIKNIL